MSNLISIGQRYDRLATVSQFTYSTDGYNWISNNRIDPPFLPFFPRHSGIGIAWTADLPWEIRINGSYPTLNGVCWGDYEFIAVGDTGTILSSTNGVSWTVQTSNISSNLNGIAWSGNVYVSVGETGTIISSVDGINWNVQTSGTTINLNSVAYANGVGIFATVGDNGFISISNNAVTWTEQTSNTSTQLNSVASPASSWGSGGWSDNVLPWDYTFFVAAGNDGNIVTSANGVIWTAQFSNIISNINGLTSDGINVIGVSSNGIIISSEDTITWNLVPTGITSNLYAAASTGPVLDFMSVIVGEDGTILRSIDAINVTIDTTQVASDIYDVTFSLYLNLFVAVGQSGLIMTSSTVNPYQTITAISDSGYISSSYDGNVWSDGSIINGNFGPLAIGQGVDASGLTNTIIIVGSQKYAATEVSHNQGDEVAQIFISSESIGNLSVDDPGYEDSWIMVYAEDSTNSRYNGVRRISPPLVTIVTNPEINGINFSNVTISISANNQNLLGVVELLSAGSIDSIGSITFSNIPDSTFALTSVNIDSESWTFIFEGSATYLTTDTVTFTYTHPSVWIVCGVSYNNPIMHYSLDDGESWDTNQIPTLFNGRALFDVAYANNQFYVSAYGVILYTYSIINPTWNATNFVTSPYGSPNFRRIASNPSGHLVAVASGLIYYTLDGVAWTSYYQPGYQFTSVIWYIDHWVVGISTLLTNYTYFTSIDTINWIGNNNNIQMYDFAVTS
jgi:hypothetical protein